MRNVTTDPEGVIEVPLLHGSSITGRIRAPSLASELALADRPPRGALVVRLLLPKYGDKRYSWDPMNLTQIREAESFFLQCIREGLTPYLVAADGNSAEPMPRFEPGAGEVLFRKIAEENKSVTMMPLQQVAGG